MMMTATCLNAEPQRENESTYYGVTLFLQGSLPEVEKRLRAFGFHCTRQKMKLTLDGVSFIIEPLRNQRENQKWGGYRCIYEGSTMGFIYLLDTVLSPFHPVVSAVEATLTSPSFYQKDWILTCAEHCRPQTLKGTYSKGRVQVACLKTDVVHLQIRLKKLPFSQLQQTFQEIVEVIRLLKPNEAYDLFSFMEGEAS